MKIIVSYNLNMKIQNSKYKVYLLKNKNYNKIWFYIFI